VSEENEVAQLKETKTRKEEELKQLQQKESIGGTLSELARLRQRIEVVKAEVMDLEDDLKVIELEKK